MRYVHIPEQAFPWKLQNGECVNYYLVGNLESGANRALRSNRRIAERDNRYVMECKITGRFSSIVICAR